MNTWPFPEEDRRTELLLQRALDGLSPKEIAELAAFGECPDDLDDLAAIIALAGLPATLEPLPALLTERLQRQASRHLPRRHGRVPFPQLGWAVAAAAIMLLALNLWQAWPTDPAVARTRLASVVPAIPWTATADAAATGASGDVVWSDARQQGYMRFVGLRPNNPSREQYQLWVFDAERDERYPVDGGVFDIPAGTGEVLVPIRVRVPVGKATLFAVTVERPGGVVVSDRKRLPLLAKLP